jgi:hypothetical protein
MHLRSKVSLLLVMPVLVALGLMAPAHAAGPDQHGGPIIRAPHFSAGLRASTARPSVVTGTESNTYVTKTGTDAGSCPHAAPCATITYAESQTASGGTIHIADGTYNQSADLTQPVHLAGASQSGVIIDGTNVDYTSLGYYGLIAIGNTSGAAGTIAISDLTVTHPYITAYEASLDQYPIDIANFDTQSGDTVTVTGVTFGPAQDEADFPGFGYYSLNAVSTTKVESDKASGMYAGYFVEGSGGSSLFTDDTASKLVGDTYGSTYYPAVGIFGLADTSANLAVTASDNTFTGYNGWGIQGEAGYAAGNCTANVCTGGLTLDTDNNCFNLTAAPAGSGVAAITASASENDSLTGVFTDSSGEVASPDQTVSVLSTGGTVNVTDSSNTINDTNSGSCPGQGHGHRHRHGKGWFPWW